MRCDKCGNDSKHLARILSEQEIAGTGTSARGTEQSASQPTEQQWCLACVNKQQ
jgi:hypothetical protein